MQVPVEIAGYVVVLVTTQLLKSCPIAAAPARVSVGLMHPARWQVLVSTPAVVQVAAVVSAQVPKSCAVGLIAMGRIVVSLQPLRVQVPLSVPAVVHVAALITAQKMPSKLCPSGP
jgi:hypothetical protein